MIIPHALALDLLSPVILLARTLLFLAVEGSGGYRMSLIGGPGEYTGGPRFFKLIYTLSGVTLLNYMYIVQ